VPPLGEYPILEPVEEIPVDLPKRKLMKFHCRLDPECHCAAAIKKRHAPPFLAGLV
jgi:hypothetical protein